MTCSEFLKELTDYLDGAMDAQTKAELEDHLQWCHNCYVVCNTTKMTIEIYRESHLYELPDDLRGRLRSAIVSKCKGHGRGRSSKHARGQHQVDQFGRQSASDWCAAPSLYQFGTSFSSPTHLSPPRSNLTN